MTSVVQGVFFSGGTPQDGAIARLWAKSAFADPGPAYDAAEPGSGQVGADVTTGTTHGGVGAYRFTGVDEGDYWLSVNHGGHRSWEAVHVGPPEHLVAPNSVKLASNVTTSGATELEILAQTLSAPAVAGQVMLLATVELFGPTVAADVFTVRLYFAGSVRIEQTANFPTVAATRATIHLSAIVPISASAGQVARVTVIRVSGTGTITAEATRCNLSWVVVPAAGVTP